MDTTDESVIPEETRPRIYTEQDWLGSEELSSTDCITRNAEAAEFWESVAAALEEKTRVLEQQIDDLVPIGAAVVPAEVLTAVLNYLATCRYADVYELIAAIQQRANIPRK